MALVKMPRVQRVPSLPPFTCYPSSKFLQEVLNPVKGFVCGGSKDLFEESKKSRVALIYVPKIRNFLVHC